MGKVIMDAAMSLDGFVADEHDAPGPIFDWYENGDVPVTLADEERVFHTSPASAAYLRDLDRRTAACVIGRRLFDITGGWGGRPPAGEAVFVVTHRPPSDWAHPEAPFTFVDGVAEAVAQARDFAGERDVSVSAGLVGGQALELGLGRRGARQPGPGVPRPRTALRRRPRRRHVVAGRPGDHPGRPGDPPDLPGPAALSGPGLRRQPAWSRRTSSRTPGIAASTAARVS